MKCSLVIWYVFFAQVACADVPLNVEDLLTAQNRWRLELGINYSNASQKSVSAGGAVPVLVQVSPAQFITLPTNVGEARMNSDSIVLTPGVRYGYSGDTELYSHASWVTDSFRTQDVNGLQSGSDSRFDSLWLGVNHQFIAEGKSPALLGFLEMAAIENAKLPSSGAERLVYGGAWVVGATAYRVIDPVVLSLTAAYRANLERNVDGVNYKAGDYFLLNPSASFAVNGQITLYSGMQWLNVQASTIEGRGQETRTTNTDFNFGLAWLWDERTTLNFSGTANVSGQGNAGLNLNCTYKLGDLPSSRLPHTLTATLENTVKPTVASNSLKKVVKSANELGLRWAYTLGDYTQDRPANP